MSADSTGRESGGVERSLEESRQMDREALLKRAKELFAEYEKSCEYYEPTGRDLGNPRKEEDRCWFDGLIDGAENPEAALLTAIQSLEAALDQESEAA